MTKNKPRHKFKQDGVRASSYCSCCGCYNCDPMSMDENTIARRKFSKRFELKLCKGCGQKNCKCKNKKGY